MVHKLIVWLIVMGVIVVGCLIANELQKGDF